MKSLQPQNLYGSIKLLSPDGAILCRCSQKKADWYLKRGLAEKKSDGVIMLRFKTRGFGDPYSAVEKKNICVVCGKKNDLTKHHIVPHCYRRHFPIEFKSNLCHDCVLLCSDCHSRYEEESEKRKKALCLKSEKDKKDGSITEAALSAIRALSRYKDEIPEDRQEVLWGKIEKAVGRRPEPNELESCHSQLSKGMQTDSEKVISPMSKQEIACFVIEWRKHFMENMAPKFMPDAWSVNGKTSYTEDEWELSLQYKAQVEAFKNGKEDAQAKAPRNTPTKDPLIAEAYDTGYSMHTK